MKASGFNKPQSNIQQAASRILKRSKLLQKHKHLKKSSVLKGNSGHVKGLFDGLSHLFTAQGDRKKMLPDFDAAERIRAKSKTITDYFSPHKNVKKTSDKTENSEKLENSQHSKEDIESPSTSFLSAPHSDLTTPSRGRGRGRGFTRILGRGRGRGRGRPVGRPFGPGPERGVVKLGRPFNKTTTIRGPVKLGRPFGKSTVFGRGRGAVKLGRPFGTGRRPGRPFLRGAGSRMGRGASVNKNKKDKFLLSDDDSLTMSPVISKRGRGAHSKLSSPSLQSPVHSSTPRGRGRGGLKSRVVNTPCEDSFSKLSAADTQSGKLTS